VTIIITDDDVRRLLPMADCIEAMRVAFRDFANGIAVNRPRMRYLARHPDPERKYLANVHVGAVPSYGMACVRAGSQIIKPASATNDRRLYENPQAFNWGIVILYSLETAEPLALMHEFQLSGMRVPERCLRLPPLRRGPMRSLISIAARPCAWSSAMAPAVVTTPMPSCSRVSWAPPQKRTSKYQNPPGLRGSVGEPWAFVRR
jgi:hypothetical protein